MSCTHNYNKPSSQPQLSGIQTVGIFKLSWAVRYNAHFTASLQGARARVANTKGERERRFRSPGRVCHRLFFPGPVTVFPWGQRLCMARSETLTFQHFPLLRHDPSTTGDNYPDECIRRVWPHHEPEKGSISQWKSVIRNQDYGFPSCPRLYYPIGLPLPCHLSILYLIVSSTSIKYFWRQADRCDRWRDWKG